MQYRKLGRTDIEVSEISFGCWTMGGPNWVQGHPVGWAEVDEAEIEQAIKTGLDAGVNHFDNADVYGNGKSERMLARVLDRLGMSPDKVVVASKVGHFQGTAEHAYLPHHIRQQCEQSLINLKRDVIDIYYFHHGDFGHGDKYLDDAIAEMNKLVAEGKVRTVGLSAYSSDDFCRLVPLIKPSVLQTWAHALDPQFILPDSPVSKLMKEYGLSLVAFAPLAKGLLLDKYNPDNISFAEGDIRNQMDDFKPDNIRAIQPKLALLKQRFGSDVQDLVNMAVNYVLGFDTVSCVIPGFRNDQQAKMNVAAAGKTLSAEDMAFIYKTLATTS